MLIHVGHISAGQRDLYCYESLVSLDQFLQNDVLYRNCGSHRLGARQSVYEIAHFDVSDTNRTGHHWIAANVKHAPYNVIKQRFCERPQAKHAGS